MTQGDTIVWSDNALCIRDYLLDPLGVNSIQSPESLEVIVGQSGLTFVIP